MKQLKICPGVGTDHPQADWILGPVGHHRDSDLITESNWDVMCNRYFLADPEGTDYEIHRFGHFAVGWVEEIAVRPGSACAAIQAELRATLEDNSVLDEDHLSSTETDAEWKSWESWGKDEFREALVKVLDAIDPDPDFSYEHDLDSLTDDALRQIWHDGIEAYLGGQGHTLEGDSVSLPIRHWCERALWPQRDGEWSGIGKLRAQLCMLATETRV